MNWLSMSGDRAPRTEPGWKWPATDARIHKSCTVEQKKYSSCSPCRRSAVPAANSLMQACVKRAALRQAPAGGPYLTRKQRLHLKHQLPIRRQRPDLFIHDHLQFICRGSQQLHRFLHHIFIEESLFLRILYGTRFRLLLLQLF